MLKTIRKPKKRRLCKNCQVTVLNPGVVRTPPHLVHPVRREPSLYDVHGHAECPDCGATWHRGARGVSLVQ